jgi:Flp pilus assembly protein TadG
MSAATASPRRDDRGSLSIMLVVLLTVTLGAAALIVDGGRAMAARRHAANTAEAAARHAIAAQSPTGRFDAALAADLARDHARRAGVDPEDVDVEVRDGPTGAPEVVVTVTARRTTVFLVLGGADELTVRSTGAATSVFAP